MNRLAGKCQQLALSWQPWLNMSDLHVYNLYIDPINIVEDLMLSVITVNIDLSSPKKLY